MKKDILIIACFIAAGIVLRLVWTEDMEWKDDEVWMFDHAQAAYKSGNWDITGMQSSAGIVNPGLSVWIFTLFGFFCSTPVGMARCVELINIFAILGFLFVAFKKIEGQERKIWLWGLALASVSPLAILFSRKIWEQDVIVLFSLITVGGNMYRYNRVGAFLWGLAGAMAGQVHMSGFFYSAGLFLFTVIYDKLSQNKTKYLWWLVGSAIGSIGLIPWLNYMHSHPHETTLKWEHLFQFSFYFYWLVDSLGVNIMYSVRDEFWELIKLPLIGFVPTYFIAIIHLFLAGTGIYLIKKIFNYVTVNLLVLKSKQKIKNYIRNLSLSEFYLWSVLLGLGVLLNFCGVITFQHYLIVAFPFSYIFLSKALISRPKLLLSVVTSQMIISISFIYYIHLNNGAVSGDYGKSYKIQIEKNLRSFESPSH